MSPIVYPQPTSCQYISRDFAHDFSSDLGLHTVQHVVPSKKNLLVLYYDEEEDSPTSKSAFNNWNVDPSFLPLVKSLSMIATR